MGKIIVSIAEQFRFLSPDMKVGKLITGMISKRQLSQDLSALWYSVCSFIIKMPSCLMKLRLGKWVKVIKKRNT